MATLKSPDEFFESAQIAALDVVVDRSELVIGGGDDDAAWFADAAHLKGRTLRIGADRERIAHGKREGERVGGQGGEINDVRDDQRGLLRLGAHLFGLAAGLLDHGGGMIDERGREAAFE